MKILVKYIFLLEDGPHAYSHINKHYQSAYEIFGGCTPNYVSMALGGEQAILTL